MGSIHTQHFLPPPFDPLKYHKLTNKQTAPHQHLDGLVVGWKELSWKLLGRTEYWGKPVEQMPDNK